MIKVAGSAHRSFVFPAELPITYAYYADVGRVLSYLPHICLVRAYGPDRFRLLYRSTELGIYHIRIFADVQTRLEEGWVIRTGPLDGSPTVEGWADGNATTAQGYFSSQSVLFDEGEQTRIEYSLQLRAHLPTPRGLRFMPGLLVERIAHSITRMRIVETAEGFIGRSVDAFPDWLAEMRNHSAWPDLGSIPLNTVPVPDCPEEYR